MYRTLLLRSQLRSLPVLRQLAFSAPRVQPVAQASSSLLLAKSRSYADAAGLSKSDIEGRVMEVMRTFEKVDGGKLSANAAFTSDLGLDSLDAVEVVMAIEEEFGIEIPDAEADEITTVAQAIDYVAKTPEAH